MSPHNSQEMISTKMVQLEMESRENIRFVLRAFVFLAQNKPLEQDQLILNRKFMMQLKPDYRNIMELF
jgi:hypothetical protein